MVEETLRSIGLSKNETKIFMALVEMGPSAIGLICGKTKIHRRNVYDSIEMLKNKGFVSSTSINNRNVFEAVNPTRIMDMLEERKAGIQSIIPKLMSKRKNSQSSIKVYTGIRGRKIIFEDKLKSTGEQYILGAHQPSNAIIRYIDNFHRRRIEKKIPLKMLFVKNEKEAARKFLKYNYIQAKLLPDVFDSPIAINIYGEKIALFLGSESIDPISILIEDTALAEHFRKYFLLLWNISKRVV